nr:RDD family protein [Planomonospora venezuelensis]
MPPGVPAPLAEWWQRLVARIVDGVILAIPMVILTFVLTAVLVTAPSFNAATGELDAGGGVLLASIITSIIAGVIFFAYEFLMLKQGGQTIGKKVMGIKVVPIGSASTAGGLSSDAAMKRAGVMYGPYLVNGVPFVSWIANIFSLVNVLWLLWDKPYQQALHDKVATTAVVKVK